MKLLVISLILSRSVFAAQVPDYKVNVGLDPASKVPAWLLEFVPPPAHHFNLNAPMKVDVLSRTVVFGKAGAEPLRIGFRSSEFKLKEGDEVASSLFLCDDAKTYCVKKTLNFPLKVNSDLQQLLFKPGKETKPAKKLPQKKTKKDELGF